MNLLRACLSLELQGREMSMLLLTTKYTVSDAWTETKRSPRLGGRDITSNQMGKGEGLAVMAGDMLTHKDQVNRLRKKAKSAEKKE